MSQSTFTRIPVVTPTTPATPSIAPTDALPTPTGEPIPHLPGKTEVTIRLIEMRSTTEGWAIGGTGPEDHILATGDGGMTWHDVTPPQTVEPEIEGSGRATAFFLDQRTAWVAYAIPIQGEADFDRDISPVVWLTRDAGQSWTASRPLDFSDLVPRYEPYWFEFVDAQHGWLMTWLGVGLGHDYVAFFRTEDGGLTWSRLFGDEQVGAGVEPGDLNLCCKTGVDFFDTNTGLITMRGIPIDSVFVDWTNDGGITWMGRALPSPVIDARPLDSPGFFCGAQSPTLFSASRAVLAEKCLLQGAEQWFLFLTSDAGETWRSMPYPGGELQWITSEIGWALGSMIYKTIDGGENWTLVKTLDWDGQFSYVDEELAWAVARSGDETALVKTANGGETWQMLKPMIAP